MLERRSALAEARAFKSDVLVIGEARGFTLTQIAGGNASVETKLAAILGPLPTKVGMTVNSDGRTIMRVGPFQFWIIASEVDDPAHALRDVGVVTPLSHSRTRIFIDGVPSRDVLAKGIPLDLHPAVFTPGMFAMTGLHHTPVLVHCVSDNRRDLYCMRTFAMSMWDWLTDAALEFASA
jgi:methylglutamate dehydrogenase subunit D